jgi:hypothetical protein
MIKMNRKEYLELCQKHSVISTANITVNFDGISYYPVGYKMTFDNNGNPLHTAILKDLKANCIVECRLDKVT